MSSYPNPSKIRFSRFFLFFRKITAFVLKTFFPNLDNILYYSINSSFGKFMQVLKISLATTLVLIFAFLIISISYFNTTKQSELALHALKEGDYDKSQKILEHQLIKKYPRAELYLSYLERTKNNFEASTRYLEQCLNHSTEETIRIEAYLGLAINNLVGGKAHTAYTWIEQAKEKDPENTVCALFNGMQSIKKHEFIYAEKELTKYNKHSTHNPWLSFSINQVIPERSVELNLLWAKLENGEINTLKPTLEAMERDLLLKNYSEINYLLGLIYLFEARQMPSHALATYIDIACSYFTQTPLNQDSWKHYKDRLSYHFDSIGTWLIDNGDIANALYLVEKIAPYQLSTPIFTQTMQSFNAVPEDIMEEKIVQ